jgi:hypothetical protein
VRSDLGWIVGCIVGACLIGIAIALHAWGAIEIRSDPRASLGLTFIGAIWIFYAFKTFPWLGLSFAYDVVDGRNAAAVIAISGAVVAVALLYAGGNIGEGPSILENFFSAGLGTAALFALWFLLEISTSVSASITEERDLGSGLRMAGLLIAASLILGRATAGNWVSVSATIRDFFTMAGRSRRCLPSRASSNPSRGQAGADRFPHG